MFIFNRTFPKPPANITERHKDIKVWFSWTFEDEEEGTGVEAGGVRRRACPVFPQWSKCLRAYSFVIGLYRRLYSLWRARPCKNRTDTRTLGRLVGLLNGSPEPRAFLICRG